MYRLAPYCRQFSPVEFIALHLVKSSRPQKNHPNQANIEQKQRTVFHQKKSVNLKYITVGRLDDDMIVPPSDGPMFILINWE